MTAWRHTHYVGATRRVTVGEDGSIVVTPVTEAVFGAQWIRTPDSSPRSDSSSPRAGRVNLLRYRGGVLAPAGGHLSAGDRIELGDDTYEVLADYREVLIGRQVTAYEVPILWINLLYPYSGDLQEQGGAEVQADVRFSVYATDETHEATGTYEDLDAEADISLHSLLRVNRQFVSGSLIYKITSAEVDREGRFVRMTVRKSGASG